MDDAFAGCTWDSLLAQHLARFHMMAYRRSFSVQFSGSRSSMDACDGGEAAGESVDMSSVRCAWSVLRSLFGTSDEERWDEQKGAGVTVVCTVVLIDFDLQHSSRQLAMYELITTAIDVCLLNHKLLS